MNPGKARFTRDSIGLALTQYLVRAFSMVRSFVAAKLLDPTSFGAWNALQLMMDYGALAPIGTQQGLDQMVPARLGASDPEGAARVKRAALFNVVVLTLAFSAAGLAWAMVGSSRMRANWHLSGLSLALGCVMCVNLANVGTSILRSHGDIGAISRWFVIQGLVGSTAGVALMVPFGRWGLLWGWVAGCVLSLLFVMHRGRRVLPLAPVPATESLDLIQVGLPLYTYLASSIVMRNLDRIVVLRFLGTQALGYYGLSVNVLTLLMAVPDALVYVSYPQFVRRYMEAGEQPQAIADRAERLVRGVSLGLPLVAGLCALWVPDAVHLLLPRYDASVPAMRALAFGATGIALGAFSSVLLMTVGRRIILVPAAVFLTALSGGLQLLAVRWNGGLQGVASAASAAYLVSGSVLLALAAAGLGRAFPAILTLLVRCLVPTGIGVSLLWILSLLGSGTMDRLTWLGMGRLFAYSAGFGFAYLVLTLPFARGIGFRALALEMNLPVLSAVARRWPTGRAR